MVRASVCRTEGCEYSSRRLTPTNLVIPVNFFCRNSVTVAPQSPKLIVKVQILVPAFCCRNTTKTSVVLVSRVSVRSRKGLNKARLAYITHSSSLVT